MTQVLAHAYKCIHIQHIPASNYCDDDQAGILRRSLPVIYLSSVKAKDTNIWFLMNSRKRFAGILSQLILRSLKVGYFDMTQIHLYYLMAHIIIQISNREI